MATNYRSESSRNLTYVEFPQHWVWNPGQKIWTPRKKRRCIGRINFVHPGSGELYYLRMLLNIVRGAQSFEDIRTLSGVIYPNFQQACQALGLLDNDQEWTSALTEASQWATPSQLRQLFTTIIIYCEVANPTALWEAHWKSMGEDIIHQLQRIFDLNNSAIEDRLFQNHTLAALEILFNQNSSSLSHFKLPMPDNQAHQPLSDRLIYEELDYDIRQLQHDHDIMFRQLNEDQRKIYDKVLKSVIDSSGGFFFVYGHGGTGKTFLWKTIISAIRCSGQIVLAVASSGIASLLLPGGRTAHSRFKIPIDVDHLSTCEIKKGTQLAKLIQRTVLIVWDEAPMIHRHCLEALDRSLQDIMGTENQEGIKKLFGGKTVLLGGDFRQILPVIQNGSKEDIIAASICKSPLWKYCEILSLKNNMRLMNNCLGEEERNDIREFAEWILSIGDGTIQAVSYDALSESSIIHIPDDLLLPAGSNAIETICHAIYTDFERNFAEIHYIQNTAIVTPYNDDVDSINQHAINDSRKSTNIPQLSHNCKNLNILRQ